jgi:hypothetical protein
MFFSPLLELTSKAGLGCALLGLLACQALDTMDTAVHTIEPPGDAIFTTGPACESSRSAKSWFREAPLDAPHVSHGAVWRNAGVVVADLNGDGHLDLFLPSEVESALRLGLGDGSFVATKEMLPERTEEDLAVGSSAADYDGDGDLDLYLSRVGAGDLLWQNDGTGHFTDVTVAAGLTKQAELGSVGSAWADMDGDGDLDLLVANFRDEADPDPPETGDPNLLIENQGDGTFVDVSDRLPDAVRNGYTWVGSWQDLDADGVMDLILINDFGDVIPNLALLNDGTGHFEDISRESSLDIAMDGMGLGVGDLNFDGLPDFLISNIESQVLLESVGDGTWVRTAHARGLYAHSSDGRKVGWGTELVDLDQDGLLDGIMSFGKLASNVRVQVGAQPDALWHQQPDGSFVQKAEELGLAHQGVGRGYLSADLNRDGWPDLVLRDRDGPGVVYLAHCGDEAWLRVSLEQEGMNRFAIGARVEAHVDDRVIWRAIHAGGISLSSSGPPEAHLGLGSADVVDVRVLWPDGTVSEMANMPTRGHLRVVHP